MGDPDKQDNGTADSSRGAYDALEIEAEAPPGTREDDTLKYININPRADLPNDIDVKLAIELSGNKASDIRKQLLACLRAEGLEAAISFVAEFRDKIDQYCGQGKTDKLLKLLEKNK